MQPEPTGLFGTAVAACCCAKLCPQREHSPRPRQPCLPPSAPKRTGGRPSEPYTEHSKASCALALAACRQFGHHRQEVYDRVSSSVSTLPRLPAAQRTPLNACLGVVLSECVRWGANSMGMSQNSFFGPPSENWQECKFPNGRFAPPLSSSPLSTQRCWCSRALSIAPGLRCRSPIRMGRAIDNPKIADTHLWCPPLTDLTICACERSILVHDPWRIYIEQDKQTERRPYCSFRKTPSSMHFSLSLS